MNMKTPATAIPTTMDPGRNTSANIEKASWPATSMGMAIFKVAGDG